MRFVTLMCLISSLLSACVNSSSSVQTGSNHQPMQKVSDQNKVLNKWYLISINGQSYDGPRLTLKFTENRISGFSGCNRYFAAIELLTVDSLKLGPVASTKKLCSDSNVNQREVHYLGILGDSHQIQIYGSQLTLQGRSGQLVFLKKSAR